MAYWLQADLVFGPQHMSLRHASNCSQDVQQNHLIDLVLKFSVLMQALHDVTAWCAWQRKDIAACSQFKITVEAACSTELLIHA